MGFGPIMMRSNIQSGLVFSTVVIMPIMQMLFEAGDDRAGLGDFVGKEPG